MAGLLLVLESDQPMKRKISEKGHGSQEGSLLGKETIFLISEAGEVRPPAVLLDQRQDPTGHSSKRLVIPDMGTTLHSVRASNHL